MILTCVSAPGTWLGQDRKGADMVRLAFRTFVSLRGDNFSGLRQLIKGKEGIIRFYIVFSGSVRIVMGIG
jgi:hypothetical protein